MPFDREAMGRAAQAIAASGGTSAAITAVFSPLTDACEEEVAAILAEAESATILNSCLHGLARRTVNAFRAVIAESGLDAPLETRSCSVAKYPSATWDIQCIAPDN